MNRTAASLEASVVGRLRSAGCVFAEDEARLLISAAPSPAELSVMVDERVGGRPLEQVLGWAEFCGLRIRLEPDVFVPRRRTEFLVARAAALAAAAAVPGRDLVLVDLCCGSGAVGAALAVGLSHFQLHAVDVHPAAVRCARRNLASVRGRVYEGDLYAPLPAQLRGRVDVLVANAPYVPTEAIGLMPPEARLYEPRVTLDGGPDGLDVQRQMIADAAQWLAPGGHLLIETSERQGPQTMEIVRRSGLTAELAESAELDATVVIGHS